MNNIRHIGFYVKKIELVGDILFKLGFFKIYDKNENWNGRITNIQKYKNTDGYKIELIQDNYVENDLYHISFNGVIPDFMKDYTKYSYNAYDDNLLVDFVYINDSIYFEFVRNKNEL